MEMRSPHKAVGGEIRGTEIFRMRCYHLRSRVLFFLMSPTFSAPDQTTPRPSEHLPVMGEKCQNV